MTKGKMMTRQAFPSCFNTPHLLMSKNAEKFI